MTLNYTLADVATMTECFVREQHADALITSVSTDTRTLQKNALFVALSGDNFDGDNFVDEAFSKGAAAAITRKEHASGSCLVVENLA